MDSPRFSLSHVVFGLILVGVGTMLLADRMDWMGIRINVPIWPFILLFLGFAKLGDRRFGAQGRPRLNRSGAWLMFLGAWGLLNEYQLFGVHYRHSWPLLVVGAGTMVVWQALDPLRCAPTTRTESHS